MIRSRMIEVSSQLVNKSIQEYEDKGWTLLTASTIHKGNYAGVLLFFQREVYDF